MTAAGVPAPRKRTPAIAWRRKSGQLPRLDDLPIPADVQPGPGWTGQMIEMADHIGAYATLCLIAAHGGEEVHIPASAERSPFADVLSSEHRATIARVYGGNRILIPVGRVAIARARRAVVIAAVRANKITGAEAQKIIGTSRTYVAHLVNHTDEGMDKGTQAKAQALPTQGDLFSLPDR